MAAIFQHMISQHNFNFQSCVRDLDFYQRIKLVNYIRRQMHAFICSYCEKYYGNSSTLENHMEQENHCQIPELKVFDQAL